MLTICTRIYLLLYAKEGTKNQAVYYHTQRNMDLNVCPYYVL